MPKRLLTIQDISCLGQCSLTVALPVISACGIECAVLPSSVLSTHTGGFSGYTFRDLTEDMPSIEAHWNKENITFDAFYTGYVSEGQIDHILNIMKSTAADGAIRIVDPAMADNGRLYVGFAEDFPEKMKKLCRGADHILPNLTEAALLLKREPVLSGYDKPFIEELLAALYNELDAKNIILTGVSFGDGKLGVATYNGSEAYFYFNDMIARMSHGTGDIYSSAFAGALLRGHSANAAAALAADYVCECIKATAPDHWYGVSFETAMPYLVKRINEK